MQVQTLTRVQMEYEPAVPTRRAERPADPHAEPELALPLPATQPGPRPAPTPAPAPPIVQPLPEYPEYSPPASRSPSPPRGARTGRGYPEPAGVVDMDDALADDMDMEPSLPGRLSGSVSAAQSREEEEDEDEDEESGLFPGSDLF
jgi:hypothetical protein